MLPNLHSLIINQTVTEADRYINFHSIICLPVLKYCKISYQGQILFNFPDDHINETSPIEHLVINGKLPLVDLLPILSYFPHLSRLSIDYLSDIYHLRKKPIPKIFDSLIHVYLNLKNISFDRFEPLITYIFKNVEVLRISTSRDDAYLNAQRWEQLILSSMTHLRIFDIQCLYQFRNEVHRCRSNKLIKQFTSSFWTQRQWYFAHQQSPASYVDREMFYSIQPYRYDKKNALFFIRKRMILFYFFRRRYYMLYGINEQYNTKSPTENDFNLVRHVHLQNEDAMNHCSFYFPNAHELTIAANSFISRDSIINNLNRILSLQQLNQIIIDCPTFDFRAILDILQFTPNCYKLSLNRIEIDDEEEEEEEEQQDLELVSQINKIRDLTVKSVCKLKEIQLLIKLFPRLQHLTIDVRVDAMESIMKAFFSETNENTQNLISLNIQSTGNICIDKILNQLQLNRRTDQFSIEEIDCQKTYLWW